MQTIIIGRHLEVTDAMRAYVEKKITKLSKHHDRLSEMQVIVAAEGLDHRIEIIVKAHLQPGLKRLSRYSGISWHGC